MKVRDAVDFIFENRGNKFQDWTREETTLLIEEAIRDDVFGWTTQDGRITGIAIGIKGIKSIHVAAIIIKAPARLREFIAYYRLRFPGIKLTGVRGNKGIVDYRRIYGRS